MAGTTVEPGSTHDDWPEYITSGLTESREYAVFEVHLDTGHASMFRSNLIYSVARTWAKDFNDEEIALARMEMRQVRRTFIAVEATTSYRYL